MSNQYVGEVRLVGFSFAPANWQQCQGQILSISSNNALFNLIGTTYGGDGQSTFALPNLQGRIPIHQGTGASGTTYVMGQIGGSESVTITSSTYPTHNHALLASGAQAGVVSPGNNVLGQLSSAYSNETPSSAAVMNNAVLGKSPGGSLPHDNLQPYLVLNWVIALFGIYPTPN
jgi:microcystin-dependent protein